MSKEREEGRPLDLEPTLEGAGVSLVPMAIEHREGLLAAAADGQLWDLRVTTVPGPETIDDYIALALAGRRAGVVIPFTTLAQGAIVGNTRFWKLDPQNRKVEIDHTWLAAAWQGRGVNREAKRLMLQHAFEVLGLIRVQFTTDELNERSQAAILKLGATFEGRIRNERIMPDGRKRNSLRYSIIDTEWSEIKASWGRNRQPNA